jgi:hypothetical protein
MFMFPNNTSQLPKVLHENQLFDVAHEPAAGSRDRVGGARFLDRERNLRLATSANHNPL